MASKKPTEVPPKPTGITGECTPVPKIPDPSKVLGGIHEAYLVAEGLSAAFFEGQVKDGKIQIPRYMHDAFDDRKVKVGIVKAPEEKPK